MKESLRILKVLMWKHMIVRRRKFVNTIFEIFLTCSLVVLLFIVKVQFTEDVLKNVKVTTQKVQKNAVELDSLPGPEKIFYTPDNEVTSQLMSYVGRNLKLKRLKYFPGRTHIGYLAIKNASELTDFFDNLTPYDALLIFHDMDGTNLPNKLNYTIRVKTNNYHTETFEPQETDENPLLYREREKPVKDYEGFVTIYEPFMRLQWAVDSSFLEMSTGRPINKKIFLRKTSSDLPKGLTSIRIVLIVLAILTVYTALILSFINIISSTCSERAAGVQELMKISGASAGMVYLSYCLNSLIMGIPFAIVTTICMCISEEPIVPNYSPIYLFIVFLLHFLSIIAFGLAVSGIMSNASHGVVGLALLIYFFSTLAPIFVDLITQQSTFVVYLLGLIPLMPISRFFMLTLLIDGVQWFENLDNYGSLLGVYVCLLAQILLYFFIAWYLYYVHPGKFGTALPWNFLCMKDYWARPKLEPGDIMELQGSYEARDPKFFDPIPQEEEIGIQINNLTKVYKAIGKQPVNALNDVTLSVCKNGITVLLGHNGAGKSTLIDIITGMQSATSGDVYVNGQHFVWQRVELRKHLGYCPQRNMLFPNLNVQEHFMFFSMLRGQSRVDARSEAYEILDKMGLTDRYNAIPHDLSGGMARRTQMGCALAGRTTVLLLDEPTSSLDVSARRSLWNVLLDLRGSCTILLSTHFLEEADALGARVCALRRGELTCDAEPMHLKRTVGEGYLVTIGGGNNKVTPAILEVIPTAVLQRKTPTSLTYSLPSSETGKLPALFQELESRRTELAIVSMGVSAPTLDEVFLKLCYDGVLDNSYDQVDRSDIFNRSKRLTGMRLWWKQLAVLFKRIILFVMDMRWMCLLYIGVPIVATALIVSSSNDPMKSGDGASKSGGIGSRRSGAILNPALELRLGIYNTIPNAQVMYNLKDNYTQTLENIETDGVNFVRSDDVFEDAQRLLKADERKFKKHLMGIQMNDTTAQILYSTAYRHVAPVALNLLSNLIAGDMSRGASRRTVTTVNHPMSTAIDVLRSSKAVEAKASKTLVNIACDIAIFIAFGLLFVNSQLAQEKVSGARFNYIRCGVSSYLYWHATLLIHLALFIVVLVPCYLLVMAIFEKESTINTPAFLVSIAFVMIVCAAAVLSFQYFLHIALPKWATVVYLVLFFCYAQSIIPTVMTIKLQAINDPKTEVPSVLAFIVSMASPFPMTHITFALAYTTTIARWNALCSLNKDKCPNLPAISEPGFNANECCDSKGEYMSYFSSYAFSPRGEVIILVIMTTCYMLLTVATQNGVFRRCFTRLVSRSYRHSVTPAEQKPVSEEREYVFKQMQHKQSDGTTEDALLVSNLHKKYFKVCRKSVVALEGVNFSVRRGECFGVLGVNGAGKSTAFKSIAGEEPPTRGELQCNGNSLKKQRRKYLSSLSYCQQYGGVDGFLTGRQCLETLLTLSGYNKKLVKSETTAWLEVVDMTLYADKKVSSYSGGCARRLAAAAALCGARPLVMLDEPSSGVDTIAKHKLWRAVNRSLGYSAVVLTSHSMDEMENLCARMCILRGGRVLALGDAHALRHAHAHAHTLTLRLAHGHTGSRAVLVQSLKNAVEREFDCTLKDEHLSLIKYHIVKSLSYSELFTKLEKLKANHAILEDYSISDTTLEEVFLAFAAGNEQNVETA